MGFNSFDNSHGGEIEIIGRAMTKQERARRQAAAAEELAAAANPSWDNRNYIPVEDLVDPQLLGEEFRSEWDADEDWGFDQEDD